MDPLSTEAVRLDGGGGWIVTAGIAGLEVSSDG